MKKQPLQLLTVPKLLRPRSSVGLIILICTFVLSACDPCLSIRTPLEAAALYDQRPDGHGGIVYLQPLDAWTRHPAVERFIEATVREGGIARLAAEYGMRCGPRATDTGCIDCFTCRATIREWGRDASPAFACMDYGTIRVQAEVGPNSAVAAMTYWETTPAVLQRRPR
jgi:hypothetical protein